MPMARARRLCPQAVVRRRPTTRRYERDLARRSWRPSARSPRWSSRSRSTRRSSTSAARCAGSGRPPRSAEHAARHRSHDEQGITCSVGVAADQVRGQAGLRPGQARRPGRRAAATRSSPFLHPLPVGALWGVGEKTEEALAPARPAHRRRHRPHPAAPPCVRGARRRHRRTTCTSWPGAATPAPVERDAAREEHRRRRDLRPRHRRPADDPPRAAAAAQRAHRGPDAGGRAWPGAPSRSRCGSPTSPRSPAPAPCASPPTSAGRSTQAAVGLFDALGPAAGPASGWSGCGWRGWSRPRQAAHPGGPRRARARLARRRPGGRPGPFPVRFGVGETSQSHRR